MKTFKYLFMSALLAMTAASCSNEEAANTDVVPQQGEVQLTFNSAGSGEIYTRGIATEAENEIKTMQIYVFSGASATTPLDDMILQEIWTKADAGDKDAKTFALSGDASGKKGSIFPTEVNNRPFLRIYCVANNGDGSLYATADLATRLTVTPATFDAGGVATEGINQTTFLTYATAPIGAAAIGTPLPMVGSCDGSISGSYLIGKVTMERTLARIDIDNDATKTGLTITEIIPGNCRPTALVTGAAVGTVQAYPTTLYDNLDNANHGVTPAAVYAYPGLEVDAAFFTIKGTFLKAGTTTQVPVTYKVPLMVTNAGATTAITIARNTRYTLRVSEVTQASLKAAIAIEEWVSDGEVNVKPDNNVKPVLISFEGVVDVIANDPNDAAYDPKKEIEIQSNGEGTFEVKVRATSTVNAVVDSRYPGGDATWLTQTHTSKVVGGVTETTFIFTVPAAAAGQPFARVTLSNAAAANDPELQTVFTVGPLPFETNMAWARPLENQYQPTNAEWSEAKSTFLITKGRVSKLYVEITNSAYGAEFSTNPEAANITAEVVENRPNSQVWCVTNKTGALPAEATKLVFTNRIELSTVEIGMKVAGVPASGPQIGDFVYSDKSYSTDLNKEKTLLGVVGVKDPGNSHKVKVLATRAFSLMGYTGASTYVFENATNEDDGAANMLSITTDSDYNGGLDNDGIVWCDQLTIGGFDNWYIPAINELSVLYDNRVVINLALAQVEDAGIQGDVKVSLTGNLGSSTYITGAGGDIKGIDFGVEPKTIKDTLIWDTFALAMTVVTVTK